MSTSRLQRRQILRRMLASCGYTDDLIAEDFPIWAPRRPTAVPDLVSFVRPDQQDMGTAAIVAPVVDSAREVRETWLSAAAAIAAPAVLVALPDHVSLWSVGVDRSVQVEEASLDSYPSLTDRLASLTPESIQRFKSRGIQPGLFPVDLTLLERSRNTSRSYLTDLVEEAMIVAQPEMGESASRPARLVIAAIATLMIRDKIGNPAKEAKSLTRYAQHTFPGYFDWIMRLGKRDREKLEELIRLLGSDVNFAGLEPSMVSDVYEQALVTPKQRRIQGTYYTPPHFAQQLLEMLPVETLAPDQRSIMDPACGSGTLLLAGADRLDQLQPPYAAPVDRHGYLTDHLRGYDQDPFAVEISKINLLMHALPIGNSWSVQSRDVLHLKFNDLERPWIIVSNPPWRYERTEGHQNERANEFLTWMVDTLQPGGFLACVLPVSWLNSNTSRQHREYLLSQCTLLEVWRLPQATFVSSEAPPAAVIAQKTPGGHPGGRVTLGKRVTARPGSLQRFYERSEPDYAYLTHPGQDGGNLLTGPITQYLQGRSDLAHLGEAADIRSGCAHRPNRPHRTPEGATHRELASARYLPAFGHVDPGVLDYVRYPEDFHRVNRSDHMVNSKKILIPAKRKAENSWRIKAGVDLIGVIPRETLYMVLPKEEWSGWQGTDESDRLYSLLAVLGSGLAACWVDELEPRRNVSADIYRSLPIPTSSSALMKLSRAGKKLADAVSQDIFRSVKEASRELELTIAEVYNLPSSVSAAIQRSLGGTPAPEGVIRYDQIDEPGNRVPEFEEVPSFGAVMDANEDGIRVWISGVTEDDGEVIPAPRRAPGWICQAGADFTVSEDLSNLENARFGLHIFEWIPEDRPVLSSWEEGDSR